MAVPSFTVPAGVDVSCAADTLLLNQIIQRDTQALASLYDHYGPLIYALALRISGERQAAEEIVVDVFYELWQSADRFRANRRLAAALLAATWRRAHHQRPVVRETEVAVSTLDKLPLHGIAQAALSAEHLAILELAYYDRLTVADIASRLDMPLSQVQMKLRQGLLLLHKQAFVATEIS